jgi:hypothetical protein
MTSHKKTAAILHRLLLGNCIPVRPTKSPQRWSHFNHTERRVIGPQMWVTLAEQARALAAAMDGFTYRGIDTLCSEGLLGPRSLQYHVFCRAEGGRNPAARAVHDRTLLTLWHGTTYAAIPKILEEGFRLSGNWAMFGAAVYLGPLEKAFTYDKGSMLKCVADVGKAYLAQDAYKAGTPTGFDSIHGRAGVTRSFGSGTLKNSEWAVPVPERVQVVEIWIRSRNERL